VHRWEQSSNRGALSFAALHGRDHSKNASVAAAGCFPRVRMALDGRLSAGAILAAVATKQARRQDERSSESAPAADGT
jgi:hypothetical protein